MRITIAAIILIFMTFSGHARNVFHCAVTSGDRVENTCDYKIALGWTHHGKGRQWYLAPGESETLHGFRGNLHQKVCDARRGGVRFTNGVPTGCR